MQAAADRATVVTEKGVNKEIEEVFTPLKTSDLKGSSILKGSARVSLAALLLLNMAILDFKEPSWLTI